MLTQQAIFTTTDPLKVEPINDGDIKVQLCYSGTIMVIYLKDNLRLEENLQIEQVFNLVRQLCNFDCKQPFTLKWVDEEGDPCTISSQQELDEAIRLYYLNNESELVFHVFPNVPYRPGFPCAGEDRNIYRRGARRWGKLYFVNGHRYQAKRFARHALCKVCNDRIWGLGRQGYKCLECKIMVHKRCYRFISQHCDEILMQQDRTSNNSSKSSYSKQSNRSQSKREFFIFTFKF